MFFLDPIAARFLVTGPFKNKIKFSSRLERYPWRPLLPVFLFLFFQRFLFFWDFIGFPSFFLIFLIFHFLIEK